MAGVRSEAFVSVQVSMRSGRGRNLLLLLLGAAAVQPAIPAGTWSNDGQETEYPGIGCLSAKTIPKLTIKIQ